MKNATTYNDYTTVSTKASILNTLYLNTQCLRNKINTLESYLVDKKIDILCLNEHWLTSDESSIFTLNGFINVTSFCRKKSSHGGTMILLNNKHKEDNFIVRNDLNGLSTEKHCELSAIELLDYNLLIICVYRSPLGDFNMFMQIFENLLSSIVNSRKNVFIAGDFNIYFHTDDKKFIEFQELILSFGLKTNITLDTRGNNCIDNVITNDHLRLFDCTVSDPGISDHNVISCKLDIVRNNTPKLIPLLTKPITRIGLNHFFNNLNEVDWSVLDTTDNALDKFNMFFSTILNAYDKSFPEKWVYSKNKSNNFQPNWFNLELKLIRDQIGLLTDISKKYNNDSVKNNLKQLKKTYKNKIKYAKIQANSDFIKRSNNKSKASWQIIKGFTDKACKNKTTLSADMLNEFFVQIPTKLKVNNLQDQSNTGCSFRINNNIKCSTNFSFKSVSFNEVRNVISKMSSSKCRDIYGINTELIKSVLNIILVPLTKCINSCLGEGIFPDSLKHSKVIPILKKGCINDPNNFRPISIVPTIGKIYEAIIKNQIVNYFEFNNLLNKNQFAYRSGKSTASAIEELVNVINEVFENGDMANVAFYDLSKAFDCIECQMLLEKLYNYYGFDENAIKLIESYLVNRYQTVFLGNNKSGALGTNFGVPQGSVLGPILFIIFINDIFHTDSDKSKKLIYADDSTFINICNNITCLLACANETQVTASKWFTNNGLCMNRGKTQNMIFSLKQDSNYNNPSNVKFLGLYLDDKLSWHNHCYELGKKISKNIFVLRHLSNSVSSDVLLTAYFSLCQSHISYGITAWGKSAAWPDIFRLQRKAIRIVSGLYYRDDCRDQFRSFKVLTLPCIYILQTLLYVKKSLQNYDSGQHTHFTRGRNDLRPPRIRLNKSEKSFDFAGLRFFNKLPRHVRNLPINVFMLKIKYFLLQKCFYSYDEYLNYNFNVEFLDLNTD